MEARSSNALGKWVHFGGDLAAGVDHGIGIIFRAASTGSTGILEPLSDSDTAGLKIRAKGAAALTLGNSSNTMTLSASSLAFSATNLTVKGSFSTTFALTWTALSSGAFEAFSIASTTADIQPGDLYTVELPVTTDALVLMGHRPSTANTSRVTLVLGNIGSTAFGATNSGTARITWIDLT